MCKNDNGELFRHNKRHSKLSMNLQQVIFKKIISEDIIINVKKSKDKKKIVSTAKEVRDHLQRHNTDNSSLSSQQR